MHIVRLLLNTVFVFLVLGLVAEAASPQVDGTNRWVVLAARQDQLEAIDLARTYGSVVDGVRVVRAKNGWFAVLLGPTQAKSMATARIGYAPRVDLPSDAYLGHLDGFLETVFEAPPSPVVATTDNHSSAPRTIQAKGVTVTLDISPAKDMGHLAMVTARSGGLPPFQIDNTTVGIDASLISKAKIITLDPKVGVPQIVVSFYTGGAHCCTITRVLTQNDAGAWSVVAAPTIDGEGYAFEDLEGDGAAELITIDNSFLYTFDSYAGSYAPPKIFRLTGNSLVDITKKPSVRPFLERELRSMEADAKKRPELWKSNGYLAGWVATKAQLGEVDDAWVRMLASYDRNPSTIPQECTVQLPHDQCPNDKWRPVAFPEALRAHLAIEGYPIPSDPVVGKVPSAPGNPDQPAEITIGSAFFITADGNLLTNAHVVNECKAITVAHGTEEPRPGKLIARDATNDLAIISTGVTAPAVASIRPGVRLGEAIAVYGFPLSGLLASGGNFTLGNVTALAGLHDDSRILQISAPVQPGNSGGPLLDETGAVVGIVVAKLNAMMLAITTADLAQNINFAIKASVAESFAEAQGLNVKISQPTGIALHPADLADLAKSFSAMIKCER